MVLASANLYFAILVSARASDSCIPDETSLLQGSKQNLKNVVQHRVGMPLSHETWEGMPPITDPVEATAASWYQPSPPNDRSNGNRMQRVMLENTTYGSHGGRCLDGSMAGYYYGRGTSNLWIIYFQGGGACVGLEDCITASNAWWQGNPTNRFASDTKLGLDLQCSALQGDCAENDLEFKSAHRVFIPYCTGDTHRGQVTTPVNDCGDNDPTTCCEEDGTTPQTCMYHSGHLNFQNILHHIFSNHPDSRNMNEILLTGGSAGGMGVIGNCDWLQTEMNQRGPSLGLPAVEVSCAPVGGWFQPGYADDHPEDPMRGPSLFGDWTAEPRIQTSLETEHASFSASNDAWMTYLSPKCTNAQNPGEEWRCANQVVLHPFIGPRMFITQNKFDIVAIEKRGLPCTEPCSTDQGPEYLKYSGSCLQATLENQTILKPQDGLWLASCADHTENIHHSSSSHSTLVQGVGAREAVTDWFFRRGQLNRKLIDDCVGLLPCNPMCGEDFTTDAWSDPDRDTSCLCAGECGPDDDSDDESS